jgi:ribosome-binding factor A
MSQRLKKINSLLQKIISEIIQKDLDFTDIRSHFYTVTGVKVSADLQHAEVYVSVLGNAETAEKGFRMLCRRLHRIQCLMSPKIRMKYTPKLHLVKDDTFAYASRIESILNRIHEEENEQGR